MTIFWTNHWFWNNIYKGAEKLLAQSRKEWPRATKLARCTTYSPWSSTYLAHGFSSFSNLSKKRGKKSGHRSVALLLYHLWIIKKMSSVLDIFKGGKWNSQMEQDLVSRVDNLYTGTPDFSEQSMFYEQENCPAEWEYLSAASLTIFLSTYLLIDAAS